MKVSYDLQKLHQFTADFVREHRDRAGVENSDGTKDYMACRSMCIAAIHEAVTMAATTADRYGWTEIELSYGHVTPARSQTIASLASFTWNRKDEGQPERTIEVKIAADFTSSAS